MLVLSVDKSRRGMKTASFQKRAVAIINAIVTILKTKGYAARNSHYSRPIIIIINIIYYCRPVFFISPPFIGGTRRRTESYTIVKASKA